MKRLALAAAVLACGGAAGAAAWIALRPPPQARDGAPVAAPDFAVTLHDGSALRRDDLLGRPWIAAFVFTRCPTVCPIVTSRLAELAKSLPPAFRIVAFSIDPAYDTREVLAAHAASLGAAPPRWAFASFPSAAERDRVVQKGFFVHVEDRPGDPANPVEHQPYVALVGADGRVLGWYDATDPGRVDALRRDARPAGLAGFYALPAVNATLNAVSAVLLVSAVVFAFARRREPHVAFVLGALVASAAFLACYLVYHAKAGSTRFPGTGGARTAYLTLLAVHTVLAAAVPPLVAVVLWKAARRDWERHKAWARATVPAWLLVSVSGIAVYWWLFRA